jgi:L-ornithine N5-oxygenase
MGAYNEPTPVDYDVVCIGFGTKGLAFSTVLADHDPSQKVLVVERDAQFNGDLGFASTESSAGSSFLRDLITLRNPRSEYTFVNFLHQTNLLIAFTNASQLITSRQLTARYMTWVAEKIQRLGWVAFNKEAVNIKPTKIAADGQVSRWTVDLRANGNGAASKITCRRLIVATGAQSRLPESLASPKLTSSVLPLSQSAELIKRVHDADRPLNIAIVGADQESVELFEHLIAAPGQHRATMILAGSALRVEDGTPFTQEMVDGASNTTLHHLPPEVRQRMLATSVAAEFPTVDLHTLEALYISLYSQQVQQPDKTQHRFNMRPHTRISGAQLEQGKVQLTASDVRSHANSKLPELYDIVIAATEREALPGKPLLAPLSRMFDSGNGSWTVDSSYMVNFRRNMLAPGCGIWVMGTLADPNVRRDNFSILSASAGRALDSMLEVAQAEQNEAVSKYGQMAML